ncbi:protein KNATM [Andrographis paniculata]|uniref:protein KNATM n=1 Tax=Andrographis paniculata TaxID=175694 RepID=UPI0021E96A15|nr:protein KNATM [Andrographis paniculata]
MERKAGSCEEEEIGQSSRISINGNHDDHYEDDNIKKEISSHSLFGLLVKSHLDCLKLCLGNMEKINDDDDDDDDDPTAPVLPGHLGLITAGRSELDQFMEAYCTTLRKVKEVIREPQQESMEFINHMYSQLQDLLQDLPSSPSTPISPEMEGLMIRENVSEAD